ncbi:hypothetical protein NBRC116494_20000 [Aurantivibrio plasticivorans]
MINSHKQGRYSTLARRKVLATMLPVVSTLLVSCSALDDNQNVTNDGIQSKDLYIVDCLLPGQIRKLGAMTYSAARRAIKTTAVDCRIRGGEYVAYDRADYRTALKVWLPAAEQGDAEAQTNVGEIFERGLRGDELSSEPDYPSAAAWYQRAAEQGFTRAQINLGYLYEKGLGVEKDISKALNWYRQASGLTEDQLVYESSANQALDELRNELNGKISVAESQTQILNKQLAQLRNEQQTLLASQQALESALTEANTNATKIELETTQTQLASAQREIDVLTQLYERAEMESQSLRSELNSLPTIAYRAAEPAPLLEPYRLSESNPVQLNDIQFGRYFALIIGNQDYWYIEDLRSPKNDTLNLQRVLEDKYGFSTILIQDADEKSILNALNDLHEQLTPEDNLLIYYAGHGNIRKSSSSNRQRGYWLPVDAQADRFSNWISNSVISDHLDRIQARSILVLADSCYAGNMASDKSPFLLGSVNKKLSKESIEVGLARRSRLVISSGGIKPVLDGTQSQYSLFAGALIDILEKNDSILRDNMLFSQLAVNVRHRDNSGENQTPEMRPIRAAGHSGGDFYLVPKQTLGSSDNRKPNVIIAKVEP